MAKSMADRYVTAKELLADLRARHAAPAAAVVPAGPLSGTGAVVAGKAGPAKPAATTAAAPAPLTPKPAGGPAYYVRLRGQTSGPYDLPTLQRQARHGLISRLHQVSSDGTSWRAASSVEGLFS